MKITLGIVNYNRLFYLKSVVKSLIDTADLNNFQLICVDGGSTEEGTADYLNHLNSLGFKVIHQNEIQKTKPSDNYDNVSHINPFSESLNIIYNESNHQIVIPLQGDQQFIRKNWDKELINLFNNEEDVGCVCLDALRRVTVASKSWAKKTVNNIDYFYQVGGFIPGAGDVAYNKQLLDKLNGWRIGVSTNSEDDFVNRSRILNLKRYFLSIPCSICIYTDESGTNCRIRAGRRFGKYWQAKDDLYYNYREIYENTSGAPLPIEELASAHGGWSLPLHPDGSFKKNPTPISENQISEPI